MSEGSARCRSAQHTNAPGRFAISGPGHFAQRRRGNKMAFAAARMCESIAQKRGAGLLEACCRGRIAGAPLPACRRAAVRTPERRALQAGLHVQPQAFAAMRRRCPAGIQNTPIRWRGHVGRLTNGGAVRFWRAAGAACTFTAVGAVPRRRQTPRPPRAPRRRWAAPARARQTRHSRRR